MCRSFLLYALDCVSQLRAPCYIVWASSGQLKESGTNSLSICFSQCICDRKTHDKTGTNFMKTVAFVYQDLMTCQRIRYPILENIFTHPDTSAEAASAMQCNGPHVRPPPATTAHRHHKNNQVQFIMYLITVCWRFNNSDPRSFCCQGAV